MAEVLDFPDISQEVKGAMNGGRLRLSEQGVTFKNNKTGKVDQIQSGDLERTNWLRVARGHELKLYLKSGSVFKYDGFKESDREKVADFLQRNYSVELQDKDLSLKGWNYGTARFEGSELDFHVEKKSAFQIPLGNVSHATTAKNEVILEFHQNDDAEVSLMEMRFFVPSTDTTTDAAGAFLDNVLAKADIIQATGDAICSLEEIPCLTPRGRYDIKFFPTFLQLHGKTFDYKIPFTTVLRLFLLPHKDNRQMFFVMSLDPPIVQGQTRYHFLILSFNKEDTLSLELNLTEEELQEKYEGKLTKEMAGPMFEIVSRLMKCLVARKITVPGSFKASRGAHAISCSYKSNSGFLYPLERGFMYVHKPPLHIRFDEIACVNFAGTGSLRNFEFEIETRNGTVFGFSSIEKDDYQPLFGFVTGKKLRVKNRGMKSDTVKYDDMGDSDDENTHDAYLEQMKAEGRQREEIDENEDSDASSDEDFNPLESASDVAEEYDSNFEPSSNDSDSDYTAGSGGAEDDDDEDDYKREMREERKERKEKKKEKKVKEKEKAKKRASDKPRKRKEKKEKDANKPKKPPSAYFIWLGEERQNLKESYPGISITELTKKAGELWQKIEDKTKWNELAAERKKIYEVEMAEYREKAAEEGYEPASKKSKKSSSPSSKKKSKKVSPSPKKPSSAGAGGNYKSKEYISSESSSDDGGVDDDDASGKEESDKEEPSSPAQEEASSPAQEEPSSPVQDEEEEDDDGAEADDDDDEE